MLISKIILSRGPNDSFFKRCFHVVAFNKLDSDCCKGRKDNIMSVLIYDYQSLC